MKRQPSFEPFIGIGSRRSSPSFDTPSRVKRPRLTHRQIAAEAIAAERNACVDFLRDRIVEVRRMEARGSVPADEADQLARRLDAVADGIGAGLHVSDGAPRQPTGGAL